VVSNPDKLLIQVGNHPPRLDQPQPELVVLGKVAVSVASHRLDRLRTKQDCRMNKGTLDQDLFHGIAKRIDPAQIVPHSSRREALIGMKGGTSADSDQV
jgi:hypothetical protein